MNPAELAQYLDVLRKAGVMSAKLVLDGRAEVAVTFEPGSTPMPEGDDLTPGGWKGPARLDADFDDGRVP